MRIWVQRPGESEAQELPPDAFEVKSDGAYETVRFAEGVESDSVIWMSLDGVTLLPWSMTGTFGPRPSLHSEALSAGAAIAEAERIVGR